ncbi:hypothetical protein ACFSLT_05700 [Novosphingobium resinovorum]
MPGIPPREVFVFLLVTGIAVMMTAFIALMQPYVFTEMVGVPRAEQGRLAGQLMTVQQAVVLVCVGFAGALADRIGRRAMVIFALVGYSMAAFAYPLAGAWRRCSSSASASALPRARTPQAGRPGSSTMSTTPRAGGSWRLSWCSTA